MGLLEKGKDHVTEKRIKLRGVQRRVAEQVAKSAFTIPHVTTIREVRMQKVDEVRRNLAGQFGKLTTMPFIIKAVVSSIRQQPVLNASLDGDDIVLHDSVNIGIAVTVGNDLFVPVMREVQSMAFRNVVESLDDLVDRTRSRKLQLEDLRNATFTITNSGALGGEIFTPIISFPQSAILGIGRIQNKPVVDSNNAIVVCPMMYLCLSYDHRIINGSDAVRFLDAIDRWLQDPVPD
jgi:pyruvate/2-oxoglutarate dehydrogenase complex dihydrolipoamide acyltransferase (E2) component